MDGGGKLTVTATVEITRLPFAKREGFGGPYPDGLAVAFATITGDGSMGVAEALFTTPAGFFYRLEIAQATRSDVPASIEALLRCRADWLSQASPFQSGSLSFDQAMNGTSILSGSFTLFETTRDANYLRRIPFGFLGGVAPTATGVVVEMQIPNDNLIVYNFRTILTYWRRESFYLPGFLSSFFEAPVVPEP